MSAKRTELLWTRRNLLVRVAFGSAAGLALAACGGGGGDDSTEDAQALVSAFDRLEDGLVWSDVERLVGFPANNVRSDTWLVWVVEDTRLSVGFYSTGSKTITTATIKVGSSVARSRDFD